MTVYWLKELFYKISNPKNYGKAFDLFYYVILTYHFEYFFY